MSLGCTGQSYQELARQMLLVCALDCISGSTVPGTGFAPPPETHLPGAAVQGAVPLLLGQLEVGMCPAAFPSAPGLPLAALPRPSPAQLSRWLSVSAVTHMALHNNQELTGTVSFHREQQRH